MDSKLKPAGSMTVTIDGKTSELPIFEGAHGPRVVDFRKFYTDTGLFTFDPGFMSTAACESAITYIDGDAGILLYRGYPIEQLAEKSNFGEVSYLLINGKLPNANELKTFNENILNLASERSKIYLFFIII